MFYKVILEKFNNLRIQTKVLFLIYGVVFVFTIFSIFAVIFAAERSFSMRWVSTVSELVSYREVIVEKEQQYLYGAAAFCSAIPEIQEAVAQDFKGFSNTDVILRAISPLYSKQQILSIIIYNQSGEPIVYHALDGSYGPVTKNIYSEPFYLLMHGERPYVWEYIDQGSKELFTRDNSPKICLWYAIKDNWSGMPTGVLAITIDSRKLYLSDSENLINKLYLIDAEEKEIFAKSLSPNDPVLTNIDELIDLLPSHPSSNCYDKVHFDKTNYDILWKKIPNTNFYILYFSEEEKLLLDRGILKVSLVTFLCFTISIGGFIRFAIQIFLTKPLNKLISSMEHVRCNEATELLSFRYRDEIGTLGNILDGIIIENTVLSEKNYLLQIHNQKAELAKLQAQVNPHFIYNSLNVIQWTAIEKGDDEIAELAYSVSQVFRLSLNHGNDFIPFFEEVEFLNFYLELQKKRFDDRLSFNIDIDEALFDIKIPKLLIQPLVENATIHGAKDAYTPVHINIEVWKVMPKHIHIRVSDDGTGIAPDKLQLLNQRISQRKWSDSNTHFALKNIAQRLALYYGDEHVFLIKSTLGKGTVVDIEIPFEE